MYAALLIFYRQIKLVLWRREGRKPRLWFWLCHFLCNLGQIIYAIGGSVSPSVKQMLDSLPHLTYLRTWIKDLKYSLCHFCCLFFIASSRSQWATGESQKHLSIYLSKQVELKSN